MIITINNHRFNLNENDEVEITDYPCEDCGSHTKITVTRNNKEIAKIGDAVRLLDREDEIYGGVVVNSKNEILPDPHKIIHLTHKVDKDGHYISDCGINQKDDHNYTFVIFSPNSIRERDKKFLCKKCSKMVKENEEK